MTIAIHEVELQLGEEAGSFRQGPPCQLSTFLLPHLVYTHPMLWLLATPDITAIAETTPRRVEWRFEGVRQGDGNNTFIVHHHTLKILVAGLGI